MSCSTGVHIIVARATNEAPGLGKTGVIAQQVAALVPGSTVASVNYPAIWSATGTDYFESEKMGTDETVRMVQEYVAACPTGKVALMGWSQGAQCVMDALCGATSTQWKSRAVLTSSYKNNIIAAVTFGDPSHVGNAPWNKGTGTGNGWWKRTDTSACMPFANSIQAWCDHGDWTCSGVNQTGVHSSYFSNPNTIQAAASFVAARFQEESQKSANTSASQVTARSDDGQVEPRAESPVAIIEKAEKDWPVGVHMSKRPPGKNPKKKSAGGAGPRVGVRHVLGAAMVVAGLLCV